MSEGTYEIYDAVCIAETEDALLISAPEFDNDIWFPKSQIVDSESEIEEEGDEGVLVIPMWLARNERLV